MAKANSSIDKVRASRDGHEYHEAWAARHAMQLLLPETPLTAISVEGLDPCDQATASAATVEIADLTFYYGGDGFKRANKAVITQFKYTIRNKITPLRASGVKETIEKFGKSFRSLRRKHGVGLVRKKITFELQTNRPIYKPLLQAIEGLAKGKSLTGEAKAQATQFEAAAGLSGAALSEFASKCHILSLSDSLRETKAELSRTIVDWSGGGVDALARARLGDLKQLVRDKAGFAGTAKNLIRHTDILAVFELSETSDLLPCPEALAEVDEIVEREQLADAISVVPALDKPLLVHAAGGVGKTVFMDSLCRSLGEEHETVFFDCFGGGDYRSPGDARHHPRRGLIHIANTLACRGLCDPIIPGATDVDNLMNTFARRLDQCVKTLSSTGENRQLVLFIDAIDNAADYASDKREDAFPVLLAERLTAKPVPGVRLVVSSRTHRVPIRHVPYVDLELRPFSKIETQTYLQARLSDLKAVEVQVAYVRSGGNPRVLQYMLDSGRDLLDASEIDNEILLDDLIQERIDGALQEAIERGFKSEDTDAFLAGLAVLPPPVPLDEYAVAHGMELSAIESFAADLWPLLDRTKHGLVFRDEPTEDLVRQRYASIKKPLRRLAKNLAGLQDRSVYAARSLPDLLLKLGDSKGLFALAFDERFPKEISSTVGQRNIRSSRLKAAIRHAAIQSDYDQLVQLTVELAIVVAGEHRGTDYIIKNPDLVIAAQDTDATRRLFETRTKWQGTRHARLAIANTLSGDSDEAVRHAIATEDWIRNFRQQDRTYRRADEGPQVLDNAAIPFYLLSDQRFEDAADLLGRWYDWYSFQVTSRVLELAEHPGANLLPRDVKRFVEALTDELGCLAAAISVLNLKKPDRLVLLGKLEKAAATVDKLDLPDQFSRRSETRLEDGLRKAAVLAMSFGDERAALRIASLAPHDRPGSWSFRDHVSDVQVIPFVFHAAISAAVSGVDVREKDLMPKELAPLCRNIPNKLAGDDFKKEVIKRLSKRLRSRRDEEEGKREEGTFSYEEKGEAEKFLNGRLGSLLLVANALSQVLRAPQARADAAFRSFVDVWAKTRANKEYYEPGRFNLFFQALGSQLAQLVIWARDDLKAQPVRSFLVRLHEQDVVWAQTLVDIVEILARRPRLQTLAGEQAVECLKLIAAEDDAESRASLYAALSRAILPASVDEAAEYFRVGLEQMDTIGSGDHEFTNYLLLLAASLHGTELKEEDFHTLTNITELNLSDEPHKFPWFAFGQGLSRASGCRGLAKLTRWDDRDKVELDSTLMPYLAALVLDHEIEPEDALALNWLAEPSEGWFCNSETFAKALDGRETADKKGLVTQLIQQYEANYPALGMASTVQALAEMARISLGARAELTRLLVGAHPHLKEINDTRNEHMNYRPGDPNVFGGRSAADRRRDEAKLARLLKRANPIDADSLSSAYEALQSMSDAYALRDGFTDKLRTNVPYGGRGQYIRSLAGLEHVNFYWKLDELKKCKEAWASSSAALSAAFRDIAIPLLLLHVEELRSHDQLSTGQLYEFSELTGVSIAELSLELIRLFAEPESTVSSSVWMSLACVMCEAATPGKGQLALTRLLRKDSARPSESVIDGPWRRELYPKANLPQLFAGIVWRQLGSPRPADRWRAAHAVRSFARLGRWQVVDALAARINDKDAGPFQAPELQFYFLHARLWLLIALARVAIDHPAEVSRYATRLSKIASDTVLPHVAMRWFSAKAVLACIDAGELSVSLAREAGLRACIDSPLPRLNKKLKSYNEDSYRGRPETAPPPKAEFGLEYDFRKEDVQYLSNVFGQDHWRVVDLIAEAAQEIDPCAEGMFEQGGRERQRYSSGLNSAYQSYGAQLGWHAMLIAAGRLLQSKPVTDDWWYDNPWDEWIHRYLLTREDGRWLCDGRDRTPLGINTILMEEGPADLEVTGDKKKILALVGIQNGVSDGVVVAGRWFSADHIRVCVSSVLVGPRNARSVIKELLAEPPVNVGLPFYQDYGEGEYLSMEEDGCTAWVVIPELPTRLDDQDPLASDGVVKKPKIAGAFTGKLGVRPRDPFGTSWTGPSGKRARSESWSFPANRKGILGDGQRLVCNEKLLRSLLAQYNSDLLLLVNLQKYEEGFRHEKGKYWNTVAVIRIKQTMAVEYHKGKVNELWTPSW